MPMTHGEYMERLATGELQPPRVPGDPVLEAEVEKAHRAGRRSSRSATKAPAKKAAKRSAKAPRAYKARKATKAAKAPSGLTPADISAAPAASTQEA